VLAWIAAVVTCLALAGHLAAEARGALLARAAGKVVASLGFVALALLRVRGAGGEGAYGRWVLAGLCLSLLGDALLLSARRPAFLAGLVAFLLAHLAYAVAFAARSAAPAWLLVPLAAALGLVLRWLWPRLGDMRGPVVAYCLVLSAMLFLALGVDRPEVRLGALLFYLSDLTVARDRFVAEERRNRLVGLPLYYAAQLLLALSIG
jgi:uncharacterized membrane protein YhhN